MPRNGVLHVSLGIIVLVTCAVSIASGQHEQWLRYQYSTPGRYSPAWFGGDDLPWKPLVLRHVKPEGVEMPSLQGARPLFAKWPTPMVKRGYLWVALDQEGDGKTYDLLYVDSDGDGHLSDESAARPYRKDRDEAYFGPVRILLKGQDGPITYHLNFSVGEEGRETRLQVSSGGWYEGKIHVGSHQWRCVLVDYNANGTFDDRSIDPQRLDRIVVEGQGRLEVRYVGNYLQLAENLYRLTVARDGAHIGLREAADVKCGVVRLHDGAVELTAGGENGLLACKSENGTCTLPVGTYRVVSWAVERADRDGNRWRMASRDGVDGVDTEFRIGETGECVLPIGEMVASISSVRRNGEDYQLSFALRGRSGERVVLSKNKDSVPGEIHLIGADGQFERKFEVCIAET